MTTTPSLNPEQLEAVKHKEGPLLVLAGAGSGKTRIVTYRIAELIDSGVHPSEILAVTFTNKAAGEMKERVDKLLSSMGRPLVMTFHSLGALILRASISNLGYPNDFTIYDAEDATKLLKGCMNSLSIEKSKSTSKALRAAVSNAKNELLPPGEVKEDALPAAIKPFFALLYKLYQERLFEAAALDFDDLLYLTVRLFREHPEILEYYQLKWPYLLIDEYQDTNAAQYQMAKMIAEKNQNLFVVGDPDQSIYSWRGANLHNILNFEKDYKGAKVVRLEQNYRSRTNILDAANRLILHNTNRYKKNLWSQRGAGEKIRLYVAGDEREEAAFVVGSILEHHKQGISLSDMTIFYRTNFQSRLFEDALLRQRLPYVIVGGISFYQRKEIKDLLAYLRMIESERDIISFIRSINVPKRGVGETTLEKLRAHAQERQLSVLELATLAENESLPFRLTAKQKQSLKEYATLIRTLKNAKEHLSLPDLLSEIVDKIDYMTLLRSDAETFEDRKANVEELIAKAAEWEMINEEATLSAFLEELSLKSSLDEADFSSEQVNLMTLHNGKGLEFEVAFLVGMEEDLFPHINTRGDFSAIEEERRLAYVGMTRAKEHLYLTAAETRFVFGTTRLMHPSRFLREIPREYIDRIR